MAGRCCKNALLIIARVYLATYGCQLFRLTDGRWARLLDHALHQGDLREVYLTAVADQAVWQVIQRLNPRGRSC
jgi:hypothetical protein